MTETETSRSRTGNGASMRVLRRAPARWLPVVMLSLWLAVEIARPPYPLKIPLLCSLSLFGIWLSAPVKRWDPVILCSLGFLAAGWVGVPFAATWHSLASSNNFLATTNGLRPGNISPCQCMISS